MHKILLADALDAEAEASLAAAAEVIRAPRADEATLCALVADCDAIVARTHNPVTRAVLRAGRKLRVVGIAGVGVDRVDIDAAREYGIAVINTPGAATHAVADLALAFMLQLLRPIPKLCDEYRAERFQAARAVPHGRELSELTVGIVGMGRIGSRVGRICAAGFGMRVLFNDIIDVGPFEFACEAVEKDTLWSNSDIVTLHVPLTPETRRLVDARVLARFRPGALLINTARGGVVDSGALVEALRIGRLGGVALDVTDPEPLPMEHPLFTCARCIITPHIAARTHRGFRNMCAVVDDVLAVLAGQQRGGT